MAALLKKIFILITIVIVFGSCSGLKGFKILPSGTGENIHFGAPLSGNYGLALYKAQMDAFGKHFSGILLFKPIHENNSYRVVMLSEFGLNLLDMSLNKTGTTIVNCQDFLKQAVIINSIEKNIRLLVFMPEGKKEVKKYRNPETSEFVIKSKKGTSKYFFFYNNQGLLTKIDQRKGFWNRLSVVMDYENNLLPSIVNYANWPVKHSMKLTLINIEK